MKIKTNKKEIKIQQKIISAPKVDTRKKNYKTQNIFRHKQDPSCNQSKHKYNAVLICPNKRIQDEKH